MPLTPKQITKAAGRSWIEVPYASWPCFSHFNKYLILIYRDHYELHSGLSGDWIKRLNLPANADPRWARPPVQEEYLFFLRGNSVCRYHVLTDEVAVLQTFQADYLRANLGESDMSETGVMVLADNHDRIYTYSTIHDTVLGPFTWPRSFNSLYITPNSDILVCEDTIPGVQAGVWNLRLNRRIAPTIAHEDVCRSPGTGHQYLIRFNAGDPAGELLDGCPNGIERIAIDNPSDRICLHRLPWAYAGHISCPDSMGRFLLSVYAPDNSLKSEIGWLSLGGQYTFLCDSGSVMMKNEDGSFAYNPTPRASVSRDGSRFAFNSNSGILDRGPNCVDVWMVKLEGAGTPPDPPNIGGEFPAPPISIPSKPIEPPIVVTPSPDLTAELQALRQQLEAQTDELEHETEYARNLEAQVTTVTDTLTELMKDLAEEKQKVLSLEKDLAATKAPNVDPEVWHAIDFLNPSQVGRRWGFEVLPNGLLDMQDVDANGWKDIPMVGGNQFLFSVENGELRMYERKTNKK